MNEWGFSPGLRRDWGVGRGSARLSSLKGREWAIVNHTDSEIVSKATLLWDGVERMVPCFYFLLLLESLISRWALKHFTMATSLRLRSRRMRFWMTVTFYTAFFVVLFFKYPLTWLQPCRFSCYMAGAVSNWTHLDLNWTEPSDVLSVLFFTLKCSKNNNKQASCWGIIII